MTGWIDRLPKWLVWELVIPLTVFNVWLLLLAVQYFQSLIAVFVVATLLSFLLDYLVCLMESKGIARGFGVLIIVALVLGLVGLVGVAIAPILIDQVTDLAAQLPDWLASGTQQLEMIDEEIDKLEATDTIDVGNVTEQITNLLPVNFRVIPGQLISFLLGFADKLLDVFITTILTLYLLLYGKSFWQGLFKWLPSDLGPQISEALGSQFKNYFFGQAVVAGIMTGSLALIFFLLHVPYWLVFSLIIGASVLIPFGDVLTTVVVSVLVGVQDPVLGAEVLIACLVTDQIVDNVFTPRILGDAVGLNPVWVFISLLVGLQVGGLLGVVIAVPLAGTLNQIIDSFRASDGSMKSLESVEISEL